MLPKIWKQKCKLRKPSLPQTFFRNFFELSGPEETSGVKKKFYKNLILTIEKQPHVMNYLLHYFFIFSPMCVTCGPNENYWPLWPQIVTISHHLFLCGTFKILNIKKMTHTQTFFLWNHFLGDIHMYTKLTRTTIFFREIIFTKISLTWFPEKNPVTQFYLLLNNDRHIVIKWRPLFLIRLPIF